MSVLGHLPTIDYTTIVPSNVGIAINYYQTTPDPGPDGRYTLLGISGAPLVPAQDAKTVVYNILETDVHIGHQGMDEKWCPDAVTQISDFLTKRQMLELESVAKIGKSTDYPQINKIIGSGK